MLLLSVIVFSWQPRSKQSSDLLLSLATAGAFWQHGLSFFVEPEDEGLDYLLDHGLVVSSVF